MINAAEGRSMKAKRTEFRRLVWTTDDTATLVRMARAGHTDVEIGRRLGVSAFVIGRKRRALGVAAGMPARLRIVIARRALPNGGRKSARRDVGTAPPSTCTP